MKTHKSCTPSRRITDFKLAGNIFKTPLPEYNCSNDPHLANYFFSKRHSKQQLYKFAAPIYMIYNSNQAYHSNLNLPKSIAIRYHTPTLPRIHTQKKLKKSKKNIHPISSIQFKNLLEKYRQITPKPTEVHATKGYNTS